MRILFIASECVPFSKTGGLADVVGALPQALAARGHEVGVFLPRYRQTEPGPVVDRTLSLPLGHELHFPAVQDGRERGGVRHYFLDYPAYFDREGLYLDSGKDYPDNAERFALFSRGAVEFARRMEPPPDAIHCHDWQSGLVPVLLKTQYAADPALGRVPVLFTIHNLGYQGLFPHPSLERIGLPPSLFTMDGLEFYGWVNYLKGGLVYADFLSTVSRRYAEEIQTEEYGHGLDGVLRLRSGRLVGILNGVDYSEWNPATDRFLAAPYSKENLEGKTLCKKDLLEQFQLPSQDLARPLIGIVSRFATQKGFDLIAEIADVLLRQDLFLVALGTGEPEHERVFRELARAFPRKVGVRIAYDNALAHKIEGGADMFLMPSRYEPCGLNQIYSLKYGTVPVVRATGGLDDTIEPFNPRNGKGTGFKFKPYSGAALLECVREALHLFTRDRKAWQTLMQNGMEKDYSWGASAVEYERLYQRMARTAGAG